MSLPIPDVDHIRSWPAWADYMNRLNDEIERRLAALEAINKTPFSIMNGTSTYTPGTYTFDVAGTTLAATNAALGTLMATLKKSKRIR